MNSLPQDKSLKTCTLGSDSELESFGEPGTGAEVVEVGHGRKTWKVIFNTLSS